MALLTSCYPQAKAFRVMLKSLKPGEEAFLQCGYHLFKVLLELCFSGYLP